MSASGPATEIVFLPGFDGAADRRADFVAALAERHSARAIGYPNRKLGSLAGYARFAAAQVAPDSRPILVAESFSGLVAARWAASDPHVAGLVLCGAFARSPLPLVSLGAAFPSMVKFFGTGFAAPMSRMSVDPARRRWSEQFGTALRALDAEVLAERLDIIATEDVSDELRHIAVPVALLQFDHDLVVLAPARRHLESVCARATVLRFAGPHFAIEVRPRETAAAIAPAIAPLFAARARPAA